MNTQKRRVIAIGFFDGVHLGHGALLETVVRRAKELDAIPTVVSFDTHPSAVLTHHPVPLINSNEDRIWLMKEYYHIEEVVLTHFDEQMQHMPWQDYITDYLVGQLGAVYLIAGSDNRFGDRGEGNAERLQQKCRELGIGSEIIGMVELDGVQVHSTLIRDLIARGEMEQANRFLGHPHVLSHTVTRGKRLGTALGFPTVNLTFGDQVLVPAYGVYATRVLLEEGIHIAVANVGVRPTVEDGGKVNAEGYILDFHGDLYGQTVRMQFFRHLRGERKFADVEALTAEVMRNAQQTRDYFERCEAPVLMGKNNK